MGKLSDAIRGIPLDLKQQQKVTALDQQFSDLQTEIQALKAENLKLQAQVNPLERQNAELRERIKHDEVKSLDETSEQLLIAIANNKDVTREAIAHQFSLGTAKAEYHFDILKSRNFIILGSVSPEGGYYRATPSGRTYLASKNKL